MDKMISSEDKRELRKKQITLLVTSYYQKLDFLHYESLDVLLEKSLDLFLDSDLTIDEINDKLVDAIASRKKALDERYDDDNVRNNHETIYGRLEQLVRELNKLGVDYQLAGALCGYIKYDQESNRCHDDIDLNVNEEDIGKLREVCSRMGLLFEDNRFSSPRVLKNGIPSGEHEVIANDPNSDFHIGVFPFERKKDGSVISKGYYHDENGHPYVREEEYPPELASELFGAEEVDFRGTPLRITPPEQIYLFKKYTNKEKDQHDAKFLEDRLDPEKLMRIRTLSHEGRVVRHLPVVSMGEDKKNNELGSMLEEGTQPQKDSHTISKEGVKMLVKKDPKPQQDITSSEDGFISNVIITTLALITFVLCFIGIALIYLIQM
ncbi:MAG: hypothetical protein IKF71_02600 [Bacilli bacterium]|nr:hypothetical protein [Bacilli bacterium]